MPPKGSKVQNTKFKTLGTFQKNNKSIRVMEDKIREQSQILKEKNDILNSEINKLSQVNVQIKEISEQVDNKMRKLRHKRQRLQSLDSEINLAQPRKSVCSQPNSFAVSKLTARRRKKNPTTSNLAHTAKVIRTKETFDACKVIHGVSQDDEPAILGMVETLTRRCDSKDLSSKILSSKNSLVKEIESSVMKDWSKNYYESNENTLRSLNTYYSHNVMGKVKYLNIRKANRGSKYKNVPVVNYIPYAKLAEAINTVDIGTLNDISLLGANEGEKGMYRNPAEFIIRLAQFYLYVNNHRADKLKTFDWLPRKDSSSFLFVVALGGDAAPICGMSVLVSFLNVGERIASSDENFLLFGADVDESSEVTAQFILKLVADMKYLEGQVFTISDVNVEFTCGELPNDMKMLAFLAGELSNSAHYFSTFANVNHYDVNNREKTLGISKENSWKPFDYTKRLSDAVKVREKKKALSKSKSSESTKRSQLTSYIAQLKSRQEIVPLVGQYVDKAKGEPLHLKNNTVKERFIQLFKIAMAQSKLGSNIKAFAGVNPDSLISKFVEFIRSDMQCNFLASKIKKWFNENNGKVEKDFTFRFRGKESYLYMKHFPSLIAMMIKEVTSENVKLRIIQIHFESIHLRQLLSYSVRIESLNETLLQNMKEEANLLFNACCLFEQRVSPSLWTLCHAAPFHAEQCLKLYKFGLGCNTMEGREQKHQRIAKYAENTTYQCRWPLIFRHEFIQLIYLRENGYDKTKYRKKSANYVPELTENRCTACRMEVVSEEPCILCCSPYMEQILGRMS